MVALLLISPASALATWDKVCPDPIVTATLGNPANVTVTVPPGTGEPQRPKADDGLNENSVPGAPDAALPVKPVLGSNILAKPNALSDETPGDSKKMLSTNAPAEPVAATGPSGTGKVAAISPSSAVAATPGASSIRLREDGETAVIAATPGPLADGLAVTAPAAPIASTLLLTIITAGPHTPTPATPLNQDSGGASITREASPSVHKPNTPSLVIGKAPMAMATIGVMGAMAVTVDAPAIATFNVPANSPIALVLAAPTALSLSESATDPTEAEAETDGTGTLLDGVKTPTALAEVIPENCQNWLRESTPTAPVATPEPAPIDALLPDNAPAVADEATPTSTPSAIDVPSVPSAAVPSG